MYLFCLTYAQAEGIPKQYTLSVLADPEEQAKTVTVKFPNGTVPGSQRVQLTVAGESLSRAPSYAFNEDSNHTALMRRLFFLFGFYGPFKNISLISSRPFIKGGRKPENPGKTT